jgi:hypothetical protein
MPFNEMAAIIFREKLSPAHNLVQNVKKYLTSEKFQVISRV